MTMNQKKQPIDPDVIDVEAVVVEDRVEPVAPAAAPRAQAAPRAPVAPAAPAAPPVHRYGRGETARPLDSSASPSPSPSPSPSLASLADAAADALDAAVAPLERVGAPRAAEVARGVAAVARAAPAAVEAVRRETMPLRSALRDLARAAERAGVARLREPRKFAGGRRQVTFGGKGGAR